MISAVASCVEKYTITGPVESVAYRDNNDWPCYIAMKRGTDGSSDKSYRQYFFHAVAKVAMCEFAERSLKDGKQVKVYAKTDEPGANIIVRLERANTNAKYWMDLAPYE